MIDEDNKRNTALWGLSPYDTRVQAELHRRLQSMTAEELRATFGEEADIEAVKAWDADHVGKTSNDAPKDEGVDSPYAGIR